jgi:class 3 adenylate cyclase
VACGLSEWDTWDVAELPSGTVTFLFTDIEGSTRLWQEHTEAMSDALARHDAIVRDAIEGRGGYVVKTTGDGAHAVFLTASDAIDAAIAAQVALDTEEWPLPERVRVRIGIHSGPAELRDGDYYGTAVNRAARIMAAAHGGQVVMSLAAEELVRDTAVEVIDLGEHRLKDLGQVERIFQVAHPELERDFPPLRSLDASRTNLPNELSDL